MILVKLNVCLLSSLWSDKSVHTLSIDLVKLLNSVLDLSLVGLDVNNENKGVGVLNELHGRLSGERELDNRELVKEVLLWGRLLVVLWCGWKVNSLSTVEVGLGVDASSLLGYSLGELLCYC